jgi:hypothetical protein
VTWYDRAACADLPGAWFFDAIWEPGEEVDAAMDAEALERAERICAGCPVRVDCHVAALTEEGGAAENRRYGVRGGITPAQRYSVWRRDSARCDRCGEVFDPLGLVAGEVVCGCGEFSEPTIPATGDEWYPRHDGLLARLTEYLLKHTEPGDRILPPYRMLEALGHRRKDDMPLVYQRLVDDGLISRGEARGVYYRLAAPGALRRWRPPARRGVATTKRGR